MKFDAPIFGGGSGPILRPGWGFIGPNPATTALTVQFDLEIEADVQIEILDLTGKKWLNTTVEAFAGNNQVELDIADFPAGVYFCHLKNNDQKQTMRFLKL